jgi:uncharacterized protein (TIGR03086 family)
MMQGRWALAAVDQTAPTEVLARACASTTTVLENVTREQLALATPCSE